MLGFASITTQTVLLREFLTVFAGNELVIGIVLANWMILTGAGAYVGHYSGNRFFGSSWIIVFLIVLAIVPIVILLFLHTFRGLVFPLGAMVGIVESFYSSGLLLAPYCIPAGFLFTLLCRAVSDEFGSNLVSRVYAIEAVGSVVGGFLVNLVAIRFLNTYEILLVLCGVTLLATFVLALARWGRISLALFGGLIVLLLVVLTVFNEDAAQRSLYKGQTITYRRDTPFGNLTVTRQDGQVNFFENSLLLFSSNDVTSNEEAVHYAMLQHPSPKRVLLIGGGVSGTPTEVLKYDVVSLDYVEVNPWLVEAGRAYTSALGDPRINVVIADVRQFFRTNQGLFDVVLINTPDPTTAQINRYYTVEFLRQLKARLTPGGVVSLSLLPSTEYLGQEARNVSSVIYRTMQSVFPNVIVVPGLRNYYIGSDSALDLRITRLVEARGIKNTYVNRYYLDDGIIASRSATILRNLTQSSNLNEDFRPLAYYRQLLYWLSYFGFNPQLPGVLLGAVVVFLALRLRPISFGIFAAGFAASAVEFLLLFSFQVVLGIVYQFVGLLITAFMGGLAAGAWLVYRKFGVATTHRFIIVQVLMGVYVILLPWVIHQVHGAFLGTLAIQVIFLLLTAVIAGLVGMQFALATPLVQGAVIHVASELYGIDLVGSAIGVLVASTFLLPLLGMSMVCYILGGLCLTAALLVFVRRK
jgi:spermidine synthase